MLKLGLNIDHVATLREARYPKKLIEDDKISVSIVEPNLLSFVKLALSCDVDSITMHLREDRRHIQDDDIYEIKKNLTKPLNLEMSINKDILDIAKKISPDYVCLVPEKREEVTTEGGLNADKFRDEIYKIVKKLDKSKVSVFIEPDINQIKASKESGAKIIELHTGKFSNLEGENQNVELDRLINAAKFAQSIGLQVNAGHGITILNLKKILEIPFLTELNIGHNIISQSIFYGLEKVIKDYKSIMNTY